jgi:chromosome segregation ATPase
VAKNEMTKANMMPAVASSHPTQQYCGVCHGALMVNQLFLLEGNKSNDFLLHSSSSVEDFPLPSAASAVGTVHPCGHLFHVSCFHNHNDKLLRPTNRRIGDQMNSLVEILDSEGASVELKSSDEEEGDPCHGGKECPTCRNRASLFVEMSSSTIHNLNHKCPLRDAIDKMTIDPSDTDDDGDADTDIMNYYSFTSLGDFEDTLFVDTTNVMHMTDLQGGRVAAQEPQTMKYTHSDASTEYHEVRNSNSKVSSLLGDTLETNNILDDGTRAIRGDGKNYPYMIPIDGLSTPQLRHFNSRAVPTTPSIMVTPGSLARRNINKKVRFFDDYPGPLLSLSSTSIEKGAAELVHLTTISLADNSDDRDDTDEEETASVEEEFRDGFLDAREGKDGKDGAAAEDDNNDHDNDVTDNDSANIPLASLTDDSQEDIFDLDDVLVLPNADSKMLLWNVSTYDEDGNDQGRGKDVTYGLRKEIDSLRSQLIQLELEKEEHLQRIVILTNTKEVGDVEDPATQIWKLKKENEELKKLQKLNHREVVSTEEELAATQIRLETAADDHQQAQAKLQRQLEAAQEELEEVKYKLETCQEQAEELAKASVSEKEAMEISHDQTQQAMKERYDEEVALLKNELDETRMKANDMKSQLETCQNEIDDAWEEAEDAQADLEACQKDLDGMRHELEHAQTLFKSCQLQLDEHKQWAEAEINALRAKHERVVEDMEEEHRVELDSKNEDYDAMREELHQAACRLIIRQNQMDEQLKTAKAEKETLIEQQKQTETKNNLQYETEINELKQTLGHAENEAEEIKFQLRACQEALKHREKAFEEEKEAAAADHKESIAKSKNASAILTIELEKELASKIGLLESKLQEVQTKAKESIAELTSQITNQKHSIEALELKVKHAEEEAECSRKDFVDKLESYIQSNEELELQLHQASRRLHTSEEDLHLDLDKQRERNGELQRQLKQVSEELAKQHTLFDDQTQLLSQLKKELKGSRDELRNQLEEQKYLQAQLKQAVEELEVSETNLNSQFEERKRLHSQLAHVTQEIEGFKVKLSVQLGPQKHLLSHLEKAKEEPEASKLDLNAEIEAETHLQSELDHANAEVLRLKTEHLTQLAEQTHLRSQLEQAKEELAGTTSELKRQVENQKGLEYQLKQAKEELEGARTDIHDVLYLQTQLNEAEASNTELRAQLNDLKSQLNQLEESKSKLTARLEVQENRAAELESQLKHTQKSLEISNDEREEAMSINLEETEEMMEVQRELESARTDMEKLIVSMKASEKELLILRKELNAAKEALVSSTNGLDLQRTSTSFSTVNGSIDEASVHGLQDELRYVKQELSAKNSFIRNQLSLAKGKLIEYVRTKEVELEDTKRELAHVKQTLKNKNGSFAKQLQTTEEELQELASMKETLQATMNELAEKNHVITKELEDAKDQLALLAETKKQLKGTEQALSATHLKLWSTFALIAVFFGHCAKTKLFSQKSPDSSLDIESEFADFEFEMMNTIA